MFKRRSRSASVSAPHSAPVVRKRSQSINQHVETKSDNEEIDEMKTAQNNPSNDTNNNNHPPEHTLSEPTKKKPLLFRKKEIPLKPVNWQTRHPNITPQWQRKQSSIPRFTWQPRSLDLEKVEYKLLKEMNVSWKQATIEIMDKMGNIVNINMIKLGNEKNPPLVCVHGFASAVGMFVANLPAFSKDFCVYAFDLIGFGRSSRPQVLPKNQKESEIYLLHSIFRVLQRVGLIPDDYLFESSDVFSSKPRFKMLGHSFGAYLSALFALRFPKLIEHVFLADVWGMKQRKNKVKSTGVWGLYEDIATKTTPMFPFRLAGPFGASLITRFRGDLPLMFEDSKIFSSAVNEVVTRYVYQTNARYPSGETLFNQISDSMWWPRESLAKRLKTLSPSVILSFIYGTSTWITVQHGWQLKEKLAKANHNVWFNQCSGGHHLYIESFGDFNNKIINRFQEQEMPSSINFTIDHDKFAQYLGRECHDSQSSGAESGNNSESEPVSFSDSMTKDSNVQQFEERMKVVLEIIDKEKFEFVSMDSDHPQAPSNPKE